jgi:hypothetical protein
MKLGMDTAVRHDKPLPAASRILRTRSTGDGTTTAGSPHIDDRGGR